MTMEISLSHIKGAGRKRRQVSFYMYNFLFLLTNILGTIHLRPGLNDRDNEK